MSDELTATWTNNPEHGQVTGRLIMQPEILGTKNEHTLVTHAMLKDSSGRKWRVRATSGQAGQLLQLAPGEKVKLTGIKGDLCRGAYFQAKRQIVPDKIEVKQWLTATNANSR